MYQLIKDMREVQSELEFETHRLSSSLRIRSFAFRTRTVPKDSYGYSKKENLEALKWNFL